MLKYDFVSRECIVSPTARRVYRISAGLSIALFFLLWAVLFAEVDIPEVLAPAVRLLLVAGIVGAAITIVGMEFFLFRFDDSRALRQLVWFVVMLFPLLGAALYCFLVYSRSDVHKSSVRSAGASG